MLMRNVLLACWIVLVNATFVCADDLPASERSAVRRYQSGLETALGKAERDFLRLQESLVQKQQLAQKRGDLKTVQAINSELTTLRDQLERLKAVLRIEEAEKDIVEAPLPRANGDEVREDAGKNNMQQRNVKTVRATIQASRESGTPLGVPVKVGDVITVRYVSGQWSNSGLGTASPDQTGEPQLRLAIAGWSSKNNLHNTQIVTVPNGTAATPFSYKFTDDFDRISLRIGDVWGVYSDNQGFVTYEVSLAQ